MFGALVVLRIVTSLVDVAVPFAAGHLVDTVATAEGHNLRPAVHALAMLLAIVFIFQILRGALDFVLIRFSSDSMARLVLR